MSNPYGDYNYNGTEYMTSPDPIGHRPMLSQSSSHSTQDSAQSTTLGSDYSNQMMGSSGQNQHYMHDAAIQGQMISNVSPQSQSSDWWPQNSMLPLDMSVTMIADMEFSQNASTTTSPIQQEDHDFHRMSIGSSSGIVEWQDKARVEVSEAAFPGEDPY